MNINAVTDAVITRAKQLCTAETLNNTQNTSLVCDLRHKQLCTAETLNNTQNSSLVCDLRHKLKRLKEKLTDKVRYSHRRSQGVQGSRCTPRATEKKFLGIFY